MLSSKWGNRSRRVLAAAMLAASMSWSVSIQAEEPRKLVNLVVILADDLGVRDLGCYGNKFHETPNLDKLARGGTQFSNAYAAAPVCSPTRASLLTGKHPARLQLTNFLKGTRSPKDSPVLPARYADFLPLEEVTLAEELKKAGYSTAAIGKWHLGDPEYGPQKQGYDVAVANYGFSGYFKTDKVSPQLPPAKSGEDLTNRLTDAACEFIEKNQKAPFCLYLAHVAPHIPLQPRADLLEKYQAKLKNLKTPAGDVYNPHYAALVESLDLSVGRVLETLERLKLTDDTAVLFLSDNGGLAAVEGPNTPSTSNSPFRGGKGDLYEGGVRIPLIVKWPGITAGGTTCDKVVSTLDVLPTVCEIVGHKPQPFAATGPLDGSSFAGSLKDPKAESTARPLFWHYPHFANQGGRPASAIRSGRWKLVESLETGACELFDLVADPGETKDLAKEKPDQTLELRKELTRWRSELHVNQTRRNLEFKNRKSLWPPYGVDDFLLVDSSGKKVGKADLLGKPWLCCFVFTRCTSTCPKVTDAMLEIQKASKAAGLRLISFSVDPDYDTPEVLDKYARGKGADLSRWSFLTSDSNFLQRDKHAIYRLIEGSFRMPVKEVTGPDRLPGFEVIHSNNIIYVDADGHPKAKYNAVLPEDVVKLRRVIEGKATPEEPAPPQEPVFTADKSSPDPAESPADDAPPELSDQERWEQLPNWVKSLPALNASLNGLATSLLIAGWVLVKRNRPVAHKYVMLAAFGVSMLFLASYLTYHAHHRGMKFTGTGVIRPIYFSILISHVVLAASVPVLAIMTIRRGLLADGQQLGAQNEPDASSRTAGMATAAESWARHKSLAKITFPIWLYVSVTGVIIYGMLYHWPWF